MHAISLVGVRGSGAGDDVDSGDGAFDVEVERFSDEDGKDLDKCCDVDMAAADLEGMSIGALIDVRGTPHNEQTREAADERPIGLRLLQTSHVQYSKRASLGRLDCGAGSVSFAFGDAERGVRYNVTFDELVNRPA